MLDDSRAYRATRLYTFMGPEKIAQKIEEIAVENDRIAMIDPKEWRLSYEIADQIVENICEVCKIQIELLILPSVEEEPLYCIELTTVNGGNPRLLYREFEVIQKALSNCTFEEELVADQKEVVE